MLPVSDYEKYGNIYVSSADANSYRNVSQENLFGSKHEDIADGDEHLLTSLRDLQSVSTDLIRNDPLCAGFLKNFAAGTIGLGITPEPMLDHELVGISEKKANSFNEDAEKLWELYVNSLDIDYARRKTFWELEKLIFYSLMQMGSVFIVRRYDPERTFSTCLQVIESHRVDTPYEKHDNENIVKGIEFDPKTGEEIAIYVRKKQEQEEYERIPVRDEQGVAQVIHLKRTDERADLSHGVPLFNNIITLLKQSGRFIQSEAKAAVLNSFVAFYTTTSGGINPLPGPMTRNMGVVNDGQPKQKNPPPSELRDGTVINFDNGETLNSVTPGRPNPNSEGFMMLLVKFMSCYLQIPHEVLLGIFNSSYSASRAAIMTAWRTYSHQRKALTQHFHKTVWTWNISENIAKGRLNAPGFFDDPIKKMAYLRCEWFADAPSTD